MKRYYAPKTKGERYIERIRDRDALRKEKSVLREEKCAFGSENVKYFGIKFESYKVKYFSTEGTSMDLDIWCTVSMKFSITIESHENIFLYCSTHKSHQLHINFGIYGSVF